MTELKFLRWTDFTSTLANSFPPARKSWWQRKLSSTTQNATRCRYHCGL